MTATAEKQIKALNTRYKGYHFRSRLEARWAVFFDDLGVRWEYEKEGFDLGTGIGWYLPDFYLSDLEWWIETKPVRPTDDEEDKASKLVEQSGKPMFFLVGVPGDEKGMVRCVDWKLPTLLEVPVPAGEISPRLLLGGDRHHFGTQCLCPVCGYDYVHFEMPTHIEDDDYKAWRGRGSAIRIPMWCEGGHKWTVRFGFHKGQTFIETEQVYTEITGFSILWKNCEPMYEHAVYASRSARFEHGECGAT